MKRGVSLIIPVAGALPEVACGARTAAGVELLPLLHGRRREGDGGPDPSLPTGRGPRGPRTSASMALTPLGPTWISDGPHPRGTHTSVSHEPVPPLMMWQVEMHFGHVRFHLQKKYFQFCASALSNQGPVYEYSFCRKVPDLLHLITFHQ